MYNSIDTGRKGLTYKGLSDRGCNSIHEEVDRHDNRAHVSRRFCEGIFEACDRGQDLAKCDQSIAEDVITDVILVL